MPGLRETWPAFATEEAEKLLGIVQKFARPDGVLEHVFVRNASNLAMAEGEIVAWKVTKLGIEVVPFQPGNTSAGVVVPERVLPWECFWLCVQFQ